jgi:hypothetical protein
MWLIADIGFFSFAEKPDDQYQGTITVQSQNAADLERLRKELLPGLRPPVLATEEDYLVEAKCSRSELASAVSDLILNVDYECFRDHIKRQQLDDRSVIYAEVFESLFNLRASKPKHGSSEPELSFGGIVVDHERGVLLRKQTGEFDGYVWTFCKGQMQHGKSPTEIALDHVRTKMGFEAEIVARLPGKFQGGHSATEYYLMRSVRDHRRFDTTKTEEVRWASFDEAESLLAETKNKAGQQRDQHVLAVTQKFLRHWATSVGWGIKEMPYRKSVLPFRYRFSPNEMARMRRGNIPNEMEDKWYIYFQDGWLSFHRSWTGYCIYRIRFESDGECHRVAECWVNREPEQYSNDDPAQDQQSLTELFFSYFQVGSDPWK